MALIHWTVLVCCREWIEITKTMEKSWVLIGQLGPINGVDSLDVTIVLRRIDRDNKDNSEIFGYWMVRPSQSMGVIFRIDRDDEGNVKTMAIDQAELAAQWV